MPSRRLNNGLPLLLFMGACFPACAHDVITTKVTWTREISRLVFKRCAQCHREGGRAFSLTTYQDARPWAKAIKEETLERRMPPWGAVKGFGSFRDDQGLTQEDLELISDWVEGGAPEGEARNLPEAPDFSKPARGRAARAGSEVIVDGSLALKRPLTVTGIHPKTVIAGRSVEVFATRPDGVVEPLLWLYNYNPQFDRPYSFETPLTFPAGTRIVCVPADAGTIALISQPAGRGTK